jgi:hypothetical protein
MDDYITIIVSFIIGVLSTIFTIKFTLKENDRWSMNQCLEAIATEINYNKTKFILLKKGLETTSHKWMNCKTLSKELYKWNEEILVTEQGKLFIPFKFDAFNFYKSSIFPWLFGIVFDYRLSELYGASKEFSYNVAQSHKNIRQFNENQQFDLIESELKNLDTSFEKYIKAFTKFANCLCYDLEYIDLAKIEKVKFKDWHLLGSSHPAILFSNKRFYKNNIRGSMEENA